MIGKLTRLEITDQLGYPMRILYAYEDEDATTYSVIENELTRDRTLLISTYNSCTEIKM